MQEKLTVIGRAVEHEESIIPRRSRKLPEIKKICCKCYKGKTTKLKQFSIGIITEKWMEEWNEWKVREYAKIQFMGKMERSRKYENTKI